VSEQVARGLTKEAPREITIEQLVSFSRLALLGHSRERLEQLAPKVIELYGLIEKVRAADVAGHEMTVNYSPRVPSTNPT